MPHALPIPTTWSSRFALPALSEPVRAGRRGAPSLSAAVAAVVAIAAERARAAGDFAALRDAIERALDAAAPGSADPREQGTSDLPRIADADPLLESSRLRALLGRLQA